MSEGNLHAEIAKVAAELYERSGRVQGYDLDNWLKAEEVVMAQHRKQEKFKTEKSAPRKSASTPKKSTKKV